jgi:hypothetical protein
VSPLMSYRTVAHTVVNMFIARITMVRPSCVPSAMCRREKHDARPWYF